MKRLVSFLLALVMLCTLLPSAFAADTTEANSYRLPETYHFTVDDEPAEIYETLLRDYGKEKADEYKRAVLIYTDTVSSIIFDVDDYELGPKEQYKTSGLQNAINHVASLIDPATVGPKPNPSTATTGATGNYYFTLDDDPVMIYVTLFRNNGEQAANHYKSLILEQDYRETHNLGPDAEITEVNEYGFESRIDFKNNFYSLDPEKQYSETVRQAGLYAANSYNDPYFDPKNEKIKAALQAKATFDIGYYTFYSYETNTIQKALTRTFRPIKNGTLYDESSKGGYGFTVEDDIDTIYQTLIKDHGQAAADEFMRIATKPKEEWIAEARSRGVSIHNIDVWQRAVDYANDCGKPIGDIIRKPRTATYDPDVQTFADVKPGDWYYEAVNALGQGELMTACEDGLFYPEKTVTVGEFCVVLDHLYAAYNNWDVSMGTNALKNMPNEIDPELYKDTANWTKTASDNLWTNTQVYGGFTNPEEFARPLCRATMLSMVALALEDYGTGEKDVLTDKTWTEADIPDMDIIIEAEQYRYSPDSAKSDGAKVLLDRLGASAYYFKDSDSILQAYNYGLTTGVDGNHTCNPAGIVTRAQLAQTLYRAGLTEPGLITWRNFTMGLFGGSSSDHAE